MDEQPGTTTPRDGKRSINWGFIVWPAVILLLYLLSYGPVEMMVDKGRISENNAFKQRLYLPTVWVYLYTPLQKPLGIYVHFWAPKYFDKNGEHAFW